MQRSARPYIRACPDARVCYRGCAFGLEQGLRQRRRLHHRRAQRAAPASEGEGFRYGQRSTDEAADFVLEMKMPTLKEAAKALAAAHQRLRSANVITDSTWKQRVAADVEAAANTISRLPQAEGLRGPHARRAAQACVDILATLAEAPFCQVEDEAWAAAVIAASGLYAFIMDSKADEEQHGSGRWRIADACMHIPAPLSSPGAASMPGTEANQPPCLCAPHSRCAPAPARSA